MISLNVSLVWPPPLLHLHLSEMPVYSPVFYLCSRLYTLALLLHDRDYLHQVQQVLYLYNFIRKFNNVLVGFRSDLIFFIIVIEFHLIQ